MRTIAPNKKEKITRAILLSGTALLALNAFSFPGHAAPACGTGTPNGNGGTDFVVTGQLTDTCHVDENDNLTVEGAGSIVTTNEAAVDVGPDAGIVTNRGLISATGLEESAIQVIDGTAISINNSDGTVLASGEDAAAIWVRETDGYARVGQIVNYRGLISGTGADAAGIYNNAEIGLIDNTTGRISAEGGGAVAIYNASGGVIDAINNTQGVIIATGVEAKAIENSGAIGAIDNTGGLIFSDDDDAIDTKGTIGSLNNTNGVIASRDGTGIDLDGAITSGQILNTGGLIRSGSSDSSAISIGTNLGNFTVIGGTIANIGTASDDGRAVRINEDQGGLIVFQGVTLVSNGTGVNKGVAILMDASFEEEDADARVVLDGNTVIRGRIVVEDDNHFSMLTSADIQGDISFGNGNDQLGILGGSIVGNTHLGSGNNLLVFGGNFTTGGAFSTGLGGKTDMTLYPNVDVVANHDIGLGAGGLLTSPGSRLYLSGGNLATTGAFTNSGTTQIGIGRTLTAGGMVEEASGRLVFDTAGISNVMQTGRIDLGESTVNLSNQTIAVNYTGGLLAMPNRSLIVTGLGGATLPGVAVEDNSFFYDFGLVRDGDGLADVYLTLTHVVTIEEAANTPGNARVAGILLGDLNGSGDPVIMEIQTRLHQASSREEFNQILESTKPTVDGGNQTAAVGMTGAMFDLADGQLAMVNTDDEETGVGSGNSLKGLHFWTQGFGGKADQGFRNGINGYDADVWGAAVGVDTRNFHPDTVVGMSLGFANTGVDSRNANSTRTDVDSYQLMAYGNHKLEGNTFLTGMAVYGWNQNEQARFNVGGISGLTAEADYDTWVGGLRGSIGRNFRYPGAMGARSFQLTPQLFSEYVHFSRDSYAETGAGGASLTVGEADQDSLNLGVSLQAEWTYIVANGGRLKPDLHASYKYDVLDGGADTTASFVAGGSTFAINGADAADSTFAIGAGLKFYDTSGWDFTANYDYTFKSDYHAHSGFLRAAYEF